MRHQVGGERADRLGVLAVGHEQHTRASVEINEQRDVIVAAARGGLVEGGAGDPAVVVAGTRLIDIMMDHPP
jgi:hypothetical protein